MRKCGGISFQSFLLKHVSLDFFEIRWFYLPFETNLVWNLSHFYNVYVLWSQFRLVLVYKLSVFFPEFLLFFWLESLSVNNSCFLLVLSILSQFFKVLIALLLLGVKLNWIHDNILVFQSKCLCDIFDHFGLHFISFIKNGLKKISVANFITFLNEFHSLFPWLLHSSHCDFLLLFID